MKKKYALLLLIASTILLCGCHSKQKANVEDEELYNYPVSIIADTLMTSISDQATLQPISEDFLDRFLDKAQNYLGTKVKAIVEFPTEWGVQCVERLPEGREIWLMQSQSREWMYIVITSGYGTQRILDLMPISVNLAQQSKEILETEKWIAYRQADGNTFTINKEYEWTKSLSSATKKDFLEDPEKYHRKYNITEQFVINADGRFEMVPIVDSLPGYDAVIFFYNRNDKPEMWDEYVPRLQAFCEENNILYEEVYQNFQKVTVHDFEMTSKFDFDITPYLEGVSCGMVMMKKGEQPKAINFGSFDYMQMSVRRYFKISNPNL